MGPSAAREGSAFPSPFSTLWHCVPPFDWVAHAVQGRSLEVPHLADQGFAGTEHPPRLAAETSRDLLYRGLFEHAFLEVHIWEVVRDQAGRILTWRLVDANAAALRSWKRDLDDILGKTTDEIFPGARATEMFMPIVSEIMATRNPREWEVEFPGTGQILQMVSFPVGEHFVSTGFDVTQMRRQARDLQEALQSLEQATRAGGVGLWDWDLRTNRVHYSKEWKRQLGYRPEEIADSLDEWQERLHPDDREPALEQARRHIAAASQNAGTVFRMRHRDGAYRWILAQYSVLVDNQGQPVRMLGSHVDITERRQLEQRVKDRTEELHRSERRQRMVLENLNAGAVVHAPDTSILYCNPLAERLLRLKAAQMLGTTADDEQWRFFSAENEPLAVEDYPVRRVIDTGRHLSDMILGAIHPHAVNDKDMIWLLVSGVPIKDDQGKLSEVVITFVDITEQRRSAEQRRQMDRFDALGRLTAGVAHELNNPLMGIINGAQYCLSPNAEEGERIQVLEDIERHTRRCIGIVESLLTFSRSGTSAKHPFVESNVERLVGHVVRLLEYRVRRDNIDMRIECAPDLPGAQLQADAFQQLLINLLTNAMDAVEDSAEKCVVVTLGAEQNELVLRVADTGIGIAPRDQARIFDPFYTTKQCGKGTGLGLSTCWAIAQDHNGSLACHSRPGKGATFTARLPLNRDEAENPSTGH